MADATEEHANYWLTACDLFWGSSCLPRSFSDVLLLFGIVPIVLFCLTTKFIANTLLYNNV